MKSNIWIAGVIWINYCLVWLWTLIQNLQLKREKRGNKGKQVSVDFICFTFRKWPRLAHNHSQSPLFSKWESSSWCSRGPLGKVWLDSDCYVEFVSSYTVLIIEFIINPFLLILRFMSDFLNIITCGNANIYTICVHRANWNALLPSGSFVLKSLRGLFLSDIFSFRCLRCHLPLHTD